MEIFNKNSITELSDGKFFLFILIAILHTELNLHQSFLLFIQSSIFLHIKSSEWKIVDNWIKDDKIIILWLKACVMNNDAGVDWASLFV